MPPHTPSPPSAGLSAPPAARRASWKCSASDQCLGSTSPRPAGTPGWPSGGPDSGPERPILRFPIHPTVSQTMYGTWSAHIPDHPETAARELRTGRVRGLGAGLQKRLKSIPRESGARHRGRCPHGGDVAAGCGGSERVSRSYGTRITVIVPISRSSWYAAVFPACVSNVMLLAPVPRDRLAPTTSGARNPPSTARSRIRPNQAGKYRINPVVVGAALIRPKRSGSTWSGRAPGSARLNRSRAAPAGRRPAPPPRRPCLGPRARGRRPRPRRPGPGPRAGRTGCRSLRTRPAPGCRSPS